jgi:hypothetical protein
VHFKNGIVIVSDNIYQVQYGKNEDKLYYDSHQIIIEGTDKTRFRITWSMRNGIWEYGGITMIGHHSGSIENKNNI